MLLTCLSGCVSQESVEDEQVERQYSFSANTLNANSSSDVDFHLNQHLENQPMILFWISTGCYGCHDWTDAFRSSVENGSLNASSIVSIHRYAEFESEEKLTQVYGNSNNSSHPSPWTVVIPNQNTTILDFNTGLVVDDLSIFEAFKHPVTPTIQIVNRDGEIAWTSKEYWPSADALNDVLQSLNDAA
jgi:hypothetical protein